MTIKQQGGVFGRNPSFNDVEVVDLTATKTREFKPFAQQRTLLT